MGVYRAAHKLSGGQVILPAGKAKSINDALAATVKAYADMMGDNDLRSY
jgi:hypothetical protein